MGRDIIWVNWYYLFHTRFQMCMISSPTLPNNMGMGLDMGEGYPPAALLAGACICSRRQLNWWLIVVNFGLPSLGLCPMSSLVLAAV